MDGFTESPLFSPHEHSLRPPDAAEAFRRKRKAQGQRACFPCRQRKVRCSFETPCQTCFTRNHPELCTYDPPLKRIHIDPTAARAADGLEISGPAQSESDWIHTKLETLEGSLLDIQKSIAQLSDAIGHLARDRNDRHAPALDATANAPSEAGAQAEGIYINPDMTGENVYLGPQSVPAMVMALGKGEDGGKIQEILGTSVLPVFGLDNETATYPFVDLWGLPHGSPMRIRELCATLPSDADCLEYFRYYRDTAHVLFPVIVDIEHFESNLTNFLITRDNNGLEVTGDELAKQEVYGKDLHWLGLLFAILASGCQCSGLSRRERQLTSQVYGKCAHLKTEMHGKVVATQGYPYPTFYKV